MNKSLQNTAVKPDNQIKKIKEIYREWVIFDNEDYLKNYRPKEGYNWTCLVCGKIRDIVLRLGIYFKSSNCVDCELNNLSGEELENFKISDWKNGTIICDFDRAKETLKEREEKELNRCWLTKIEDKVWAKKNKRGEVFVSEPKRKDKVELVNQFLNQGLITKILSKKQWEKL